jgi:hypothetical protein
MHNSSSLHISKILLVVRFYHTNLRPGSRTLQRGEREDLNDILAAFSPAACGRETRVLAKLHTPYTHHFSRSAVLWDRNANNSNTLWYSVRSGYLVCSSWNGFGASRRGFKCCG